MNQDRQQPEWLDLKALQQYACVSERTLREWIHRPIDPLPAVRVGTKILVRRSILNCWLESRVAGHAEERDHNRRWHPAHRERAAFRNGRRRCNNSKAEGWKHYGGRGIRFLFASFEQFFAELGPRPSPGHSLDRINNDGHYEPGNVRWATQTEQQRNKRPRGRTALQSMKS